MTLMDTKLNHGADIWLKVIWKENVQIKMIIFLWLVWRDKNLTWRNLQRKGWEGPGFCILCGMENEDNYHLFYHCYFAKTNLELLCTNWNFTVPVLSNTMDFIGWWFRRGSVFRAIPILFHWFIWCNRNINFFEGR